MRIGAAWGHSPADMLPGAKDKEHGPAFLTGTDPAAALRMRGEGGVSMQAAVGDWDFGGAAVSARMPDGRKIERLRTEAVRNIGPLRATLAFSQLRESGTLLGSRPSPLLGIDDSVSDFASIAFAAPVADGWSLGATVQAGRTNFDAGGGLAVRGAALSTSAFAVDLTKTAVLTHDDQFGLRVSQPLRYEGAAIDLELPTGFDYRSETASFSNRRLSLDPSGREIAFEAAYVTPIEGGSLSTNAYLRRQPDHVASATSDIGVALRLSREF